MSGTLERVLVTGGTGFLGAALVRRLVALGKDVVVFDNNFRGKDERIADVRDAVTLISGDIREQDAVNRAAEGCETIYHLAFVNGTRFFYEKPDLVLDVGVRGALTTLCAAREAGASKYVLASSSEVYQQPTQVPTPEAERAIIPDVTNPRFSYAGGKLISELLTLNMLRDTVVDALIFRPHNVFGPNMGFEHVIPELVEKLHKTTNGWTKSVCTLPIQGSGEETRAFCYVEDAVDQILAVANAGTSRAVYHIGQQNERTIRQLATDIAAELDINVDIQTGELRSGGTTRRCPNIDKVKALGYTHRDRYAEGLAETVAWYREYWTQQGSNG